MWETRTTPLWENAFLTEVTEHRELLADEYRRAQRRTRQASVRSRVQVVRHLRNR